MADFGTIAIKLDFHVCAALTSAIGKIQCLCQSVLECQQLFVGLMLSYKGTSG